MTRVLSILLLAGLLASCTVDRAVPATVVLSPVVRGVGDADAAHRADEAWPFAPRSLRVHPLTHVDVPDPLGDGTLILHVELRDRFGDSVKGVGQLSVELASTGGGAGFAAPESRVKWDITDIADPQTSSRRFDPATRTYRVPLKSPAWVSRWLSDESERRGGPEHLTLRATFTPTAGEDRRVLTDEYQVEP
jgi:hypothetical protein